LQVDRLKPVADLGDTDGHWHRAIGKAGIGRDQPLKLQSLHTYLREHSQLLYSIAFGSGMDYGCILIKDFSQS
jgi:hypothetical protein